MEWECTTANFLYSYYSTRNFNSLKISESNNDIITNTTKSIASFKS
jgi:hypothetical protein